jgi:elongation factor Ts
MNPKSVGVLKTDDSVIFKDVATNKNVNENEDSSLDNIDENKSNSEIEEDGMLEQDFLLDPSMTVGQVATDYGIDVLDFVRYECGET